MIEVDTVVAQIDNHMYECFFTPSKEVSKLVTLSDGESVKAYTGNFIMFGYEPFTDGIRSLTDEDIELIRSHLVDVNNYQVLQPDEILE